MKIEKYFPNFTKKAITFTIDDGSLKFDKIFIDILRPHGIKGTFNLCLGEKRELTDEEYRAFYEGFEIANHCFMHPYATDPEKEYVITDAPFTQDADKTFYYKTDREGVYRFHNGRYWAIRATTEAYLKLCDISFEVLEGIFGKGKIKGFVWPYGQQNNKELYSALINKGYQYIRKTGNSTFDLPSDRMLFSYNANADDIDKRMEEFDAIDSEELKFFCFGVHSVDFERSARWDVLKEFATKYGDRPNDFWYAGVSEIFDYEDALGKITVADGKIINPTETELFIAVNGEKTVLSPNSVKNI